MSLFGRKEKEKIAELNILIDGLEKEIIKIKAKEEQLADTIQKKDIKIEKLSKSPHDRQFEKITLEFDKVKIENTDLKRLNENLKLENKKLIAENHEIIEKITKIEKMADSLREENETLKQPKIKREKPRYRVLIKDLYSARKHDEFKKICENSGLIYVNELENLNFEKLIEDGISKTKINNAKDEYIKFKNGEFNSEIEEYLVYGHKISKVFFRYRSFVSYLMETGIKYICQLENFDFEGLKGENFTPAQIEKLKEKITEYNKLRKK
ncbi:MULTISPECIES: hypothetical protein [Psychrilyobacter]|uniref:Uncharacterized protein n=1 Tax=Psychrilyobacter piezotolerans TaxID=2293438 RepID=A0ABX9KJC9_9FUSO|nr:MULTISPECIES: hypothetical protein [Psychrilyobacter]MCS5421226.1 hypothetical protein [Psychrilyobacter sp. S5]NDI77017.1 hypothetical protein [Psychrilyobacter piezotolerans]RDE64634.1 hypothetical protein DV867_03575 [Psychrilyobacter sp. S5]REI42446.1 hypothetical protein DYH56_03575 [Psychrilyobacter piezotolerans]